MDKPEKDGEEKGEEEAGNMKQCYKCLKLSFKKKKEFYCAKCQQKGMVKVSPKQKAPMQCKKCRKVRYRTKNQLFCKEQCSVDLGETSTAAIQGVNIETLQPGDGTTFPSPGQRVTCHYVLTLADGTKIDSSRDRSMPFQFTLGRQEVIPGWETGLARMSKGQRARITVDSDMGYGDQGWGNGKIPGGATLIFDVELLDVQDLQDPPLGILGNLLKGLVQATTWGTWKAPLAGEEEKTLT